MVIERFGPGALERVGERFRARGRLIPEGSGVAYVDSWMTADGSACFQIMEAPSREALNGWIAAWSDLVSFEVARIERSAAFWEKRRGG